MGAFNFRDHGGSNIKKLLILDRDGTLNKRVRNGYVLDSSQIELAPEFNTLEIMINRHNISFGALVTNQSCINKELVSWSQVHALNSEITSFRSAFKRWSVFICPHLESENCACRKPKGGLIRDALKYFRVSAADALMVGDSESDFRAAAENGVDFNYVCWDMEKCPVLQCGHRVQNVINSVSWC